MRKNQLIGNYGEPDTRISSTRKRQILR